MKVSGYFSKNIEHELYLYKFPFNLELLFFLINMNSINLIFLYKTFPFKITNC